MSQFDYYYSREAEQFTFYRIPKVLFTEEQFRKLSIEAKVLYGLMLDRMSLSMKSGWLDEQGRVYIYFTVADVQECLNCGRTKAIGLLKELDAGFGLIERKRQGLGKPDRVYVMNFISNFQKSENCTSGSPNSKKHTSGGSNSVPQEVPKTAPIDTENIKTEIIKTESIHPIPLLKDSEPLDGAMDMETLKGKWGYRALLDNYDASDLDSLFLLGLDVLNSSSASHRIGGQSIPSAAVRKRLLSLDLTHIDYVLECLKRVQTPIRNMRSYLLTSLYNAPSTIDAYYTARVSQDEAAGKEVMPPIPNYSNVSKKYERRSLLC